MIRQIILDTETTGLEWQNGDRLIEIGCVELVGRKRTGRRLHMYVNPEREVPEGAVAVHGITTDFLADKPKFRDVVDEFVDFVRDAELVIHNAAFDVPFLNAELGWCSKPQIPMERAIDTLLIARKKFPGAGNSLDALCRRFGIDNAHRTLHGALLDSEILAEVYLELVGGRQPGLVLGGLDQTSNDTGPADDWRPRPRPEALPSRITPEEAEAHQVFVEKLGEKALWAKFSA